MTDVTEAQARAAKDLVNTAGAHGALITLAGQLPPEVLAQLRAAHEDKIADMCCAAHGEGMLCCIDILLEDPVRYAPGKVAEAEELLRRYREQLSVLSRYRRRFRSTARPRVSGRAAAEQADEAVQRDDAGLDDQDPPLHGRHG